MVSPHTDGCTHILVVLLLLCSFSHFINSQTYPAKLPKKKPVWKRCRALPPQRPEYFCVFSSATAHYHVSERIRWCVLYVSSTHEFIFINELNWVQLRCKTGWSSIRGLREFKQRVQQLLKGHWAKDCPCSFQIKSFLCYVDVAYIVNNAKLLPQST